MKSKNKFGFLNKRSMMLVLTYCVLTIFNANYSHADDAALQPLRLAQQDFLKKDGTQLLRHLKDALTISKNHPLVVKNIADLFNSAEARKLLENAQVDWKVPSELKYLNVSVVRKYMYEDGRVRYFVTAGASQSAPNVVEQFQLIRYPDEVILDKSAKIGKWREQEWAGQPTFWTGEEWHASPVKEGLYLINIKIKDQPMVQGWFIINDENSSASPVVKTPTVGQVFTNGQPTMIWKNFVSPEKRTEDRAKISFKISQEESGGYEETVDANLVFQPEFQEMHFQIGDRASAKDYLGHNILSPGNYHFSIGYREMHNFGDLLLVRVSSSKVPFSIAPKK